MEWGEYKIGDLFSKKTIKGIPKSEENLEEKINGYHVYGQNISYQYPQKVINDSKYLTVLEKDKPIIAYTSSTAQIGIINESFYRTGNNGAFQGLFPKFSKNNFNIVIFILECIKRTFVEFGYNTSMANILDIVIQVPTKNKELDFGFMESFIAELEAERIAELSAYLKASGLDNYELSDDERNALLAYDSIEWGEYRIGDLFDITHIPSFNKERLTKGNEFDYVTRTSLNQGILQSTGFVNEENLNEENVWSLGLLQMDFFYRKRKWYAGQFVRKVIPKFATTENNVNFFSVMLNQIKPILLQVLVRNVDETFKNQIIGLPTKNKQIDFDFITKYTRAITKLAIKDVVQYTDKRIETTKMVVAKK